MSYSLVDLVGKGGGHSSACEAPFRLAGPSKPLDSSSPAHPKSKSPLRWWKRLKSFALPMRKSANEVALPSGRCGRACDGGGGGGIGMLDEDADATGCCCWAVGGCSRVAACESEAECVILEVSGCLCASSECRKGRRSLCPRREGKGCRTRKVERGPLVRENWDNG